MTWTQADVARLLQATVSGEKHSDLERLMHSALPERLRLERPLKVKLGLDPKTPSLHVGHLAPLLSLKRFQDLGHKTYLLLGGFTARFGDPSGKKDPRAPLSQEDIQRNALVYENQAFRIVDRSKTILVNNSVWFDDMNAYTLMAEVARPLNLAVALSHGPFRNRYKAEEPLSLVELLYTSLQAYDSMVLCAASEGKQDDPAEYRGRAGDQEACCDVEIGGEDQTFNFITTRRLMRARGLREEIPVVLKYATGVRNEPLGPGKRRYMPLSLPPDELYRFIVAVPDKLLIRSFRSITDLSDTDIASVESQLNQGDSSQRLRKLLARTVVRLAHGEKEASLAERDFEGIPRGRVIPKSTLVFTEGELQEEVDALNLVQAAKLAESEMEAEFLFSDESIFLDDEPLSLGDAVCISDGSVLQRGRRLWAKAVLIKVVPEAILLPYSMVGKEVDAVDVVLLSKAAGSLTDARLLLKQRRIKVDGIELRTDAKLSVRSGVLVEIVESSGKTRPIARLDLPE